MKIALITGVTGQDGSLLSSFLLEKKYKVIGMVRRTSTPTDWRLRELNILNHPNFLLCSGDLTDQGSIERILYSHIPDEVYNLGAQSFVGSSWDTPVSTIDITGLGAVRLFDAVRNICPAARIYQASSSEMFGGANRVELLDEGCKFDPQSPYGVAKVAAHHAANVYRHSFNMFISCGILFNHECIVERTPLSIKKNGIISIVFPSNLIALCRKGKSVQTFEINDCEIWDGERWVSLHRITATKRRVADLNHKILNIQCRGGTIQTTSHHNLLKDNHHHILACEAEKGIKLLTWKYSHNAKHKDVSSIHKDFAELLGYLCSDGFVSEDGRTIRFINNNDWMRDKVASLWRHVFLGDVKCWTGKSGFSNKEVKAINLIKSGICIGQYLRSILYDKKSKLKRVPDLILNSTSNIMETFFEGYYNGDGLKAGKGKSFKTNSPLLAQGLIFILNILNVDISVYDQDGYYLINMHSQDNSNKGQHLIKDKSEIRKIDNIEEDSEIYDWVFDIETSSHKFAAGVGKLVIANSEYRGEQFVTRKVTKRVAEIFLGLKDNLQLHNLDSVRDWGYAPDYVKAMWMMLQHTWPDDFVVATAKTYSIKDLCNVAFAAAGIDGWQQIDIVGKRPGDVKHLHGDYSKAESILGWEPETNFKDMIFKMVNKDIERLKNVGV